MKKIIALLLALAMLTLVGCGGGTSSTANDTSTPAGGDTATEGGDAPVEGEGLTIAFSTNALDEYMTEWLGYYTDYFESRGHTIIVTNADGKVDKQISDVEALIQREPDLIAIRAVDNVGIIPAFEACVAAGIPTVDITMQTETDGVLHLFTSQLVHGNLQGEWCNNWLDANPGETIKAGYLWGTQGSSGVNDRYNGWKDIVEEKNADRFEILIEKVCNWSAAEAMAVVEDWMQAYPEMNVIVAASDEMAIAATNVLEAAGKTGQVFVLGIDGSINGQATIREGKLAGSSYLNRQVEAEGNAEYCLRLAQGETELIDQWIDIGGDLAQFLTIDNIDEIVGAN